MHDREAIIEAARACVGTPFRHQGRRPGHGGGLDCLGIVRHAGIVTSFIPAEFDFRNYGPFPNADFIARELDRMLDRVIGGLEFALDGDVPLFADERWSHMGVLSQEAGTATLIHTTRMDRFCIEHHLDAEWRRRVRGIWRFRGLV
jgi:hypothetical protein